MEEHARIHQPWQGHYGRKCPFDNCLFKGQTTKTSLVHLRNPPALGGHDMTDKDERKEHLATWILLEEPITGTRKRKAREAAL